MRPLSAINHEADRRRDGGRTTCCGLLLEFATGFVGQIPGVAQKEWRK